ncbi:hypothetical protein EVAR_63240_1 [Eumeta japonica]|uniref:Uncharacterized protein n=1 Tax=Eumeta variegata TaxID=151549 RepID=A0A4C1Z9V2_EUMVA|nr:hypothetical protein EVAR_63240_1 [Eumeta japonica]
MHPVMSSNDYDPEIKYIRNGRFHRGRRTRSGHVLRGALILLLISQAVFGSGIRCIFTVDLGSILRGRGSDSYIAGCITAPEKTGTPKKMPY